MIRTFKDTQDLIENFLAAHSLGISPDALQPLRRIDFSRLTQIHDHEEYFLRETFFRFLLQAHHARLMSDPGAPEILRQDVRTAMLMLGTALPAVDEASLSKSNKAELLDLCPYCKRGDEAAPMPPAPGSAAGAMGAE